MTPQQIKTVQASFADVKPIAATAAGFRQALHERLFRATLVELGTVHQHQLAATRRRRIEVFQGHRIRAPS